jgi:dynactin complex subunit
MGSFSREECLEMQVEDLEKQLTEAQETINSLRLDLIETQAELQRHNAIMVDNGVRAEKAEQENKRLRKLLEQLRDGRSITRADIEQALKKEVE